MASDSYYCSSYVLLTLSALVYQSLKTWERVIPNDLIGEAQLSSGPMALAHCGGVTAPRVLVCESRVCGSG
jgi:hypothetical protein